MPEYSTLDPNARRELMSSLADGEVDSAAAACALWATDPDARQAWHAYHLIGDLLRSDDLAAAGGHDESFLLTLRGRLAAEPVVLAPMAVPAVPGRRRWLAPASMAAGVAVVASALLVLRMSAPGAERNGTPLLVSAPLSTSGSADDRPGDPQWRVVDGNLIRDARLDAYLRAHRGGSAAMPGGATGRFETVVLER